MGLLRRSKRVLLFEGGYQQKLKDLFGSSIIGYWPGNEPSGSIAYDLSGRGFHGAYTGVTLGQPGIGDGLTCPLYDGIGDYNNVYSEGLNSAFNNAEGTIAIWAKVSGVGVWTDATARGAISIGADGNNRVRITRTTTNNQMSLVYAANAAFETVNVTVSSLDWMHFVLTWSVSADQVKAYYNGGQTGSTLGTLGVWAGAIAATHCVIGASFTTSQYWDGYAAHGFILNRAATPAEVAAAALL